MTAVHVIAPPAPTAPSPDRRTDAACVLLASRLLQYPGEPAICLGPMSARRSLAAFGVEPAHTLLPRRGVALTAARRLRSLLSGTRTVHAWGVPAIEAVLFARPKRSTVIAHADDEPTDTIHDRDIAHLTSVEAYDELDAQAWRDRGVADARIDLASPSPRARHDSRDAIRAALGIRHDDVVLAALWDPPSTLDARRFVFRVGFLELLNRPTVAIFPSLARRLVATRRFRAAASLRFRLLIAPVPIAACLPACDTLAPLEPVPGHPRPARGAVRVINAFARSLGVTPAEPRRSPEPTVVSREMAEFSGPLIESVDHARAAAEAAT